MKTSLLLILLLFFSLTTNAQGYYRSDRFYYDLDTTFNREDYSKMVPYQDSSFVLLDRTIIAYQLQKSYILDRTYIEHKVYYIGNADDIEKINRLYLYKGSEYSDAEVTVRTIKPNGDVVKQDKSKLEEVETDNGNASYVILAISGIEVNSYVEVLVEKSRQSAHNRVSIDNPFPTLEAEIFIHASEKLNSMAKDRIVRFQTYGKFEQKTIVAEDEENDYLYSKQLLQEDVVEKVEKPVFVAKNIVPYSEESYSHEYSEASFVDIVDLDYTWRKASDGIKENMFPIGPKHKTSGRFWLRDLGIFEDEPIAQIRTIEKFIKQEITLTESSESIYENTKKIWRKRIANETGMVRMAEQLFNAAELSYIIYLCSKKGYIQINRDFPFTIGLSDIVFYFPNEDIYFVPDDNFRYAGELPNYLASVEGLRLKSNNLDSNLKRVKRMPSADKEYNMDGTRSIISIDEIEETCSVAKTKMFYGNRAIGRRGYYHFSDDDDRKEYIEALLVDKLEMELSDVKVTNEALDLNFQSKDTLFYSGTLTGSQILSSIPNGFILNPGAVMGTQVSFYDTEERKSDIYITESKVYEHTIIVEIPDGYAVEGTDKLAFDKQFFAHKRWLYGESEEDAESFDEAEVMAQFVSEVTVSDSQVRIDIYEYYVEGFYPKQGIEDLQEVVNAAYEFFIAKIKLVKE